MSEKQITSMGMVALVSVPVLAEINAIDDCARCGSDYRLPTDVEHIPTDSDEDIYGTVIEIPISNYIKLQFGPPQKKKFAFIED